MASTTPDAFVSPTLLKKTVQQLRERLDGVHGVSNPATLRERVKELETKASAPDFWNDRQIAEGVLTDLKDVKEDLRVIDEMEKALEEISVGYELMSETEMQEDEMTAFQVSACINRSRVGNDVTG